MLSRIAVCAAALVVIGAVAAPAWATLIAYEGYNYTLPAATKLGAATNGGTGWGGGWVPVDQNGWEVSAAGLTYAGLATPVGVGSQYGTTGAGFVVCESIRPLANSLTTGVVYVSALVMDPSGNGNGGDNHVEVILNSGGTGKSYQGAFGLNDTTVEIAHATSGASLGTSYSGTGYARDVTHLVVAKIDLDAHTIAVFANPTPGGTEPSTPLLTDTFGTAGIGGISTRSYWSNGQVDEIRVGTTWADVTPAVPEPGSVILLLCGATALLRGAPPQGLAANRFAAAGPATMALLAFGGFGVLLRRGKQSAGL